MRKRFLGIPAGAIIAVLAVLLIGTTTALALFLFQQSNPGTVTIKGSGAALYSDAGCTTLLESTDVLDFGEVRNEAQSDTVTVYLKNIGTDPLYPTLKHTGLNSGLKLVETTIGKIGMLPVNLYQAAGWANFTPGAVTNRIVGAMTNSQTDVIVLHTTVGTNIPSTPLPWFFKIDDEVIKANAWDEPTKTLSGLERGIASTSAVVHLDNTIITFGTCDEVPVVPMAVGAVLPVELHLEAEADLTPYLGEVEDGWTVDFEVTSDY